MTRTILFAFLVVFLTFSVTNALTPVITADEATVSQSRHYDPGHNGHKHKCNRCGALYHQPGDMGAGSSGTYTCPRCGNYNNPAGPSGPSNPYNPPYNPPTPNYPPTYPNQPNYDNITADQIIRHARRASTYTEQDRILTAGARQLRDVSGVLKVAAESYNERARRDILNQLNSQRQWINFPSRDLILRLYNKMSTYTAGDDLILYSGRFVHNVNDLMFLSVKMYDKNRAIQYMEQIRTRSDINGQYLSLRDVRTAYNQATTYQLGDRMLLAVVRFFNNYDDIMKLGEMAYSSSVRRQIQDRAYGYNNHNNGNWNYSVQKSVVNDLTTVTTSTDNNDLGISLDKQDIRLENIDAIRTFVDNYKNDRIKKSPLLLETIANVRSFLRSSWMQTQDEKVKDLLDTLK